MILARTVRGKVDLQLYVEGMLRSFAGHAGFPVAGTGDRVNFTGVAAMSLRDGKVIRVRQYVDYTTFTVLRTVWW